MAFPQYVDISSFQPSTVDWPAYVAWSKVVDGVARLAVRASEGTVPATPGTNVGDTHYDAYVSGIRAADPNAVVLHYHYAYPQFNSPADEVNWMAEQVNRVGLNPQDVVMLDFEENSTSETDDAWALAWLQAAQQKFGRVPVIYASDSMVRNRLQNAALIAFGLIDAKWDGGTTPPTPPPPWTSLWAWQYTDSLSGVPGFGSASVDADFFMHVGATPPPPPAPAPALVTNHGAVLDLQKSFQLDGGSQMKCGPWTASELRFAGLPGQGPRGSATDVGKWASAEYTKWIGPDVPSDQQGSSIDNMHEFFVDATDPKTGTRNLHWHDIPAISPSSNRSDDNKRIIRVLNAGYAAAVTVNEQSVKRPDGTNPYPWQPALGPVNHVFTIIGHTPDGFFLVDDELNKNDAWPDKYSQSALEIHWASVVQVVGPDPAHPWLLPIPDFDDPLQWPAGFIAQTFGGEPVGVPTGWTLSADGSTLTASNGVPVHTGFKDEVINAVPQWDQNNVPQTAEYHTDQVLLHRPDLGGGQVQPFRDDFLWWTSTRNQVVREKELGIEIYLREQKIAAITANLTAIQAQLTQAQQQLAECQAAGGGVPPDVQAAINSAVTQLQGAVSSVSSVESQLQPFVK